MKHFKTTYPLCVFVFLCVAFMSCTAEPFVEQKYEQSGQEDETKLLFTVNMPEGTESSSTDGKTYEQYINDVYVYVFNKMDGSFIEQVENLTISGNNGDKTRLIFGVLKENYTAFRNGVEVVLLVNLDEKGVAAPKLTQTENKNDLYNKLTYTYNSNSWNFKDATHYIPMWGICSFDKIEQDINRTNISLYRAIAKINVTLNNGKGFDHFRLKEVQVCNVNTKGYCAPLKENLSEPSIPVSTDRQKSVSFVCNNDVERTNGLQERIYIPEYKNINVESGNQSYLKIIGTLTAKTGEQIEKKYSIFFKKNGIGDTFDVLRNNLYIFNITSISNEVNVESHLSYTVEKWEQITIDIPPFN